VPQDRSFLIIYWYIIYLYNIMIIYKVFALTTTKSQSRPKANPMRLLPMRAAKQKKWLI
jgi:hypothetical protein